MRWQINHIWGDRPGCWRCGVSGLSGHKQRAMQENVSSPTWERRGPPAVVLLLKLWFSKQWTESTSWGTHPNKASSIFNFTSSEHKRMTFVYLWRPRKTQVLQERGSPGEKPWQRALGSVR